MSMESAALVAGTVVGLATLAFLALQTRHLSAQTRALTASIHYSSYLKLVDYLNDVSLLMINSAAVGRAFEDLDFIRERLEQEPELSLERVALAWMILNRYEAAMVGHRLGAVSSREWAVWLRRLELDLQIPFLRTVWLHDVQNFEYDRDFKNLMARLLPPDAATGA